MLLETSLNQGQGSHGGVSQPETLIGRKDNNKSVTSNQFWQKTADQRSKSVTERTYKYNMCIWLRVNSYNKVKRAHRN